MFFQLKCIQIHFRINLKTVPCVTIMSYLFCNRIKFDQKHVDVLQTKVPGSKVILKFLLVMKMLKTKQKTPSYHSRA